MTTPIKKYNYERSAYRWLLARHPKQFEARGVTTTVLERAPAARKAFWTCGWPGAQLLIRCVEGRYERTVFFDTIIARGLQLSTRFAYPHLTPAESDALQIRQSGAKHYLSHFLAAPDADRYEHDPCCALEAAAAAGGAGAQQLRSDAQRALWRTISGHISPELAAAAPHRSITVTKAVKTFAARTITQIVIEIDSGDMSGAAEALSAAAATATTALDAFDAAAAAAATSMPPPASIPPSPEHPPASSSSSSLSCKRAFDDAPFDFGAAAATSYAADADATTHLCGEWAAQQQDGTVAKRARTLAPACAVAGSSGGCGNDELAAWGLTDTRFLDDVDVDILSGLF
ncbi:hypothetical protein JKP88DRAFT_208094 [Tribonema minus]|uniref:Uncharacterized protein n=1 Tax=Tribonema minus TaxID=303371 RepID=A0A836CGN8_9STRA|nr:hypothetical protein JKP88DRAFT_208094 [Tribonema minus]